MGVEIERRFLVSRQDELPPLGAGEVIIQCYPPLSIWSEVVGPPPEEITHLLADAKVAARLRLYGNVAWATIKGPPAAGEREEIEWEISLNDARSLIESGDHPSIWKSRHLLPTQDGLVWEVDLFGGDLDGLIIAEIELPHIEHPLELPRWVGSEITDIHAWSNQALARNGIPDDIQG
jgi:adenylate cyclase